MVDYMLVLQKLLSLLALLKQNLQLLCYCDYDYGQQHTSHVLRSTAEDNEEKILGKTRYNQQLVGQLC